MVNLKSGNGQEFRGLTISAAMMIQFSHSSA